jgi:3-deoxy-D-manno-octulosonate 8-phosphate phosphatase (KDO 8-P phosphatase)
MIDRLGLVPRQVCFVGDDLPDLPVLRAVGLAACPADAAVEVQQTVHLVTRAAGGRGAVREVVEIILKAQGNWDRLLSSSFDGG